jgi:CTP:molybdopterin cytidylyltransferase MocA
MVATILVRRIRRKVSVAAAGRGVRTIISMLGPSRRVPTVGARARIAHFGGGFEQGIVVAVHEEGRRLEVRCEEETLEFVLNPATARFVSAGSSHGPRLELLAEPA